MTLAARCWSAHLLALLAVGCSGPSAAPTTAPNPVPPVFGCPSAPPTPSAYPPPTAPFAITFTPDPVWVGLAGPLGRRDTIVTGSDINVDATGKLYGSITKVHRVLRDRDSGQVLGELTDPGSFPYFGNTPCRSYDPLLLYGHENLSNVVTLFRASDPLGFQRRPAILSVDITVVDTANATWTVSKSVVWDLLPAPTPLTPANVTVRQNDPASGCAFDAQHGYGVVLDLAWDVSPVSPPISWYALGVLDAAGNTLFGGVTTGDETTSRRKRVTVCNTHVDNGANRAAKWTVSASYEPSGHHIPSDFGVATFDFQPCREAGVPACQ